MKIPLRVTYCLLALCTPLSVYGDIYQCGSMWQNEPCKGGSAVPALPEKELRALDKSEAKSRELRNAKQYLWRLEGRYSKSVINRLREAIVTCEQDATDECKELSAARAAVEAKVEQINSESAKLFLEERARVDSLAIEKEKLNELRKQTELQRETLIETQNQRRTPLHIRLEP